MAAKVIAFPGKTGPKATEIEEVVRQWLLQLSGEQDFIDTIAERMMNFITNYTDQWVEPTFDLVVPATLLLEDRKALLASVEKGIDDTAGQVQEMINRIIIVDFFLRSIFITAGKESPISS
jgi:hypothetical protein